MNDEPTGDVGAPGGGGDAPDPEEMRRAMEEQLGRLRMEDVLVQSVASMLNLSARRIGKEDERDLEQARLGIEACRRLTDLLPEQAEAEVRNALSEVQMLFAQAARGPEDAPAGGGEGGAEPSAGEGGPTGAPGEEPRRPDASGPGGRRDSGLWVPPGT